MKKHEKNMRNWIKAFPEIAEETFRKYGPILVKDIRSNTLRGQVLNRQTGELQKSIQSIVTKDKNVHLLVGTEKDYGAIWFNRGRDFLNPPIDNKIDDILKDMVKRIEKRFIEEVS